MKKVLFTTTLLAALSGLPVFSSTIVIDYQGEPVVTSNNIEQRLILRSDDDTRYDIAIRPLEEYLTSSNGNIRIPLDCLFINNNREDVYLRYNEYSNLFSGVEIGGTSRSITAKVKDFGIVPSGVYSMNFEIQATDLDTGTIASTTTFNLRFIIPIVHELNLYSENPKILIEAANAFEKNKKIRTENVPRIYVRSNTDWILYLDTNSFGDTAGNYYVRTTFGTDGVTNRLQEYAQIIPGREIILARGKAPALNEQVAVEYAVESADGKCIPAGRYINKLRYVLREGKE